MTIVNWASGVPTKILRNGTGWDNALGFVEDETLSGKKKRRASHTSTRRPFNVAMRFTLAQYDLFQNWWDGTCRKGLYAFYFPKVDSTSGTQSVYQFKSAPKFDNPSGDYISCTMTWEEVL